MNNKKKKKIFMGFADIAGQLFEFAEAYKEKGHEVLIVVRFENESYPNRRYSKVLHRIYPTVFKNNRFVFFRKLYTLVVYRPYFFIFMLSSILKYDIFHFMWYIDRSNEFYLRLIKLFKKKIIVSFVGGDIRWMPCWTHELEMRNLNHVNTDIAMQNTLKQNFTLSDFIRTVRVFEKFSSIIISHPEQSQLQLRPYVNFFLPLDIKSLPKRKVNKSRPLVSIGLRNDNYKGGTNIIKMIQEYKQQESRPDFDLIFLENMNNYQVLEVLSESDIFVYSPYIGSAGKFGHEAVASGAVALVSYDPSWFTLPPDPPFVPITEATLIEKLDHFLRNQEEREAISKKGIEWAKKWTDIDWITADILDKLENNREPDYYPQYFRQHATFKSKWDSPDSLAVANKWTRYVSNTDWYKKYIKSGKREGLEF